METIRNRLIPFRLQLFAEPGAGGGNDPAGGGTDPAGGNNPAGGNDPAGNDPKGGAGGEGGAETAEALKAQIEQMKADLAKQKEALNKATHEASEAKKSLKAKMTQEEIDAANKKEADEKAAQELENLRKEVSRAKNTKSVMGKLNVDEETAGKIAESLMGCENIDNALLLIQRAWTAKEKALRIEFGKIPGPGQGGGSEEDAAEKAAIELGKKLGRERADANKSVAEVLKGYIR